MSYESDIREFTEAQGVKLPSKPGLSYDHGCFRYRLMREELEEYLEAIDNRDIVAMSDAVADLLYVVFGTALEHGLPIKALWDEVHRTNMAKFKHGVIRDAQGKVQKPDGWEAPRIKEVLNNYMGFGRKLK